MDKIEIPTAQNIKVEYQLSSLVERAIAFVIDYLILGIYSGIMALIILVPTQGEGVIAMLILVGPVVLFYHLLFEVFNNGQSLGKRLMGMRVVKTDGKLTDFKSYLIRYVFRMVDILLTGYTVGILCIVGSTRNQRLGDLLADTAVVKVKGGRRFSLKSVEVVNDDSIELVYKSVVRLKEEEMLVVQETVQRYKQYRNPAHTNALNVVALKMVEILKEDREEAHDVKFLEHVLHDYVQLTR